MRSTLLLGVVLSTGLMAMPASAGYVVSATLASKPDINGTDFDYTIVLTNATTSTLPLGTFWFSWEPGEDFMSVSPTNIVNPTGWKDAITGGGPGDGFAIQWEAMTPAAAVAGASLTFAFTSSETLRKSRECPQVTHRPWKRRPSFTPGAPFADPGLQFNVVGPAAAVPEPSSLALCGIAGVVGLVVARARRRASAA